MSSGDDHDPAALRAEDFLDHLRAVSRRLLQGDAARDLRCSCDMWTIDPQRVDPLEPLANRGCRTISWPSDTWSSISSDLLGAVQHAAESEDESLPVALAEYAMFVHLELAAREDPPQGVRPDAFVLPLRIAARERVSSTAFRRYVLGWHARAATSPWNDPEMAFAASLTVAMGSTRDAVIGEVVGRTRARLDHEKRSARVRYRDLVPPHHREFWSRAAAASAPDARAWAAGFMR